MAGLHKLHSELLTDGKITPNEVAKIKDHMAQDGVLDYQDIKFLVGLTKEADDVCSEFDDLFFPCLRDVILKDGSVGSDEQYLLLQMLYSDGRVRDAERRLLTDIYREAEDISPEFERLCKTALECNDENWALGGRVRND